MIMITLHDTLLGQLVELRDRTKVRLDSDTGEEVTLPAGTYLEVKCKTLPLYIRTIIKDGDHEGRVAYVLHEAEIKP